MKINDEAVRFDWFFSFFFSFFTVSEKEGNLLGKRDNLYSHNLQGKDKDTQLKLRKQLPSHVAIGSNRALFFLLLRRKIKLFNFHHQTHRGSKMGLVPQQKQIIFWEKSPVIFSLSRHWFKLSVPETSPASLTALFLYLSRFPREDNHLSDYSSQKVWRCQVNTPLAH